MNQNNAERSSSGDGYLFHKLVVSLGGSTINVSKTNIMHNVSSCILGQYPAPDGYKYVKIDGKVCLEHLETGEFKSCREGRDATNTYFFHTGYFFSEPEVHRMNMRSKLRAVQ